jgi:hypothetical protein
VTDRQLLRAREPTSPTVATQTGQEWGRLRGLVLVALVAAPPALAAGGAPAGRYEGVQKQGPDGNGSAHRVSFRIQGGKLRGLVIGAGQAYCHPPKARKPGFAPGYFIAPSPRLSRFPVIKLVTRGAHYQLNVIFKHSGKTWKITHSRNHPEGSGYVAISGYFSRNRFVPLGRRNLIVQYGGDANGRPIYRPGPQQCNFAGRLTAGRH